MKQLYFLILLSFALSCHKKNDPSKNLSSVLMQHSWYVSEIKKTLYNESTNTVYHDTAYLAEDCLRQEIFRFLKDSVFERTMHCAFPESLPPIHGKWYLSGDSMLVSNYLHSYPPASGYPTANFGFGDCKILEINDVQLTLLRMKWFYTLNGDKHREETILFCKSKK